MQLLQHFKEFSLHPKNAGELRGLILQLAIQGKLTSNWRREHPSVEPASILLARIQKEKAKLVKEKKIRKEKALSKINDDEVPYELPEHWEWSRLGNYSHYGALSKCENVDANEVTWVLELEDIEKVSSKLLNKVRFSERDFRSTKSVFKASDVIYGKLRPYLDKVLVADEDGVCTTEMIPIKSFCDCSPEYLRWYLKHPGFIEYANGSTHGMRMPRMGTDVAKKAIISVPPLAEQKAVVEVVNRLLVEVEQLEALNKERIRLKSDFVTSALQQLTTGDTHKEWAFLQQHFSIFFTEKPNIEKLRESILQLAVQGKLTKSWRRERSLNGAEIEDASVLLARIKAEKEELVKAKKIKKEKALPEITGDEIPYELPEGWAWCRPLELSLNIVDCPHSTPKFVNEGKACIDTTCMDDNGGLKYSKIRKVSPETFDKRNGRLIPKAKDIIYAREGSIGKSVVIPEGLDVCLGQRVMIYRLHQCIDPFLFRYTLVSPMFMEQVSGNHKGLGAKHINMSDLRSMPVPLIPVKEQQAIVQKINALMGLCDALEQQIQQSQEQSEQFMKSCLREVFAPQQTKDELINSLLPELESLHNVANLQQAMVVQKTQLGFGSGRGKVYLQKTSANLKNIKKVAIGYTFEKSHHGEFSWRLSEDLDKNPYLRKVTTDYGEIYEVKANQQHAVLKALNSPANFSFVQALDELIQVYKNKLINGATDRVELLNTVCKAITDTHSIIGNTIYRYMQDWEIKQNNFKTKADKFTQSETFAMIQLITQLGWDKELTKSS